MSVQDFKTNWRAYTDAITTKFPDITEERLADADGDPDALAAILSRKAELTRAEARNAVEEVLSGPMPADGYADPTNDDRAVSQSDAYVPDGEDALSDDRRFGDDNVPDTPMGRDAG